MRRARENQPAGSGWRTAVEHVIQDLEGLNGSTERDFLAIGEKLMGFRATARQIAADMAALTELISGERGRNASHALSGLLEHSREMDVRIERSSQAFERVHGLAGCVRLAFAGLRNMVTTFHSLCTLTRIETSRLGSTGADFGDLAAEVKSLSESIQSSGEDVLEKSSRLVGSVQSVIRSVSDLRGKHLRELPDLIAGVIDGLKTYQERQQRAVESSARQVAEYGALCDAVEGIVQSLQFHDITRQQVEHVVEALRHLSSASGNNGANMNSLPPDACAILALQSSQLAVAAETFASSVGGMERDLTSIAVLAEGMPGASRALLGISADDQDSFFLRMEGHFTSILKMLGTCAAAQAEMGSTAAGLDQTIAQMRDSVAAIRGIEILIQRVAINATVRAAHLGAAGSSLNAIAEAMQRLALDANTNTEDVAGTLDAIRDAAARVSGGSGRAEYDAETGTGAIAGEMQRAVLELHSSSERSVSRVQQIAGSGARLAQDIGAVRGSLSAGRLFADVVNRARTELARIGGQAGLGSLECAGVVPTRQLERLAENYTMQRERDVHQSVAGGSAIVATPTGESRPALEDGEWGDNVELF